MNLLRRAAALLILLTLVVAAPICLWTWGGQLLPASLPSPAQAWDSLTSQDTGDLFMGALVVIGWVAWALFTVSVLVELAAAFAGLRGGGRALRSLRRRLQRLPVIGGAQTAAGALVGAVLAGSLLMHAPAVAASPSSGAGLAPLQHRITVTAAAVDGPAPQVAGPAATPRAASPAPPTGPTWTVHQGDTLWDIAEQTLGDPLRYPEIVELNVDAVQPDGARLVTADTWLQIGWRLTLPGDAHVDQAPTTPPRSAGEVTVQAGDTLSQIAQDHLGSAQSYPALAEVNHLSDADTLQVGQVLVIPEATTASTTPAVTEEASPPAAPPTPAAAPPDTPSSTLQPEMTPPPPATPAAQTPADVAAGAVPPGQPSAPAATSTISAPSTPAPPEDTTAASDQPDQSGSSGLLTAAGGLTAAALLAGLLAARRRSHRRRRPGRAAPVADLQGARVEKAARDRADGHDPAWVDRALRTMAAATVRDWVFADIIGAVTGTDGLRLQLAEHCAAPEPFTQDGSGWFLPATTPRSALTAPDEQAAPLPALATVAVTAEHAYLLDLERAQALHVTGPDRLCREFLNHLAADLATNLWSDGLDVTLVGWGRSLTGLDPGRLTHLPAVSDAVDLLRAWLTEVADALPDADDSYTARLHDHNADAFTAPVVLLIDASTAGEQDLHALRVQLDQLMATGRAATAVILTGADDLPHATPVRLHTDGTITLGQLWADTVLHAPRLTDQDLDQLLQRTELGDEPDTPPAAAADPAPWADNMDVHGALLHRVPGAGDEIDAAADLAADHIPDDTARPTDPAATDPDRAGRPAAPIVAETGEPTESAHRGERAAVVDIRPGATDAARQLTLTLAADPDLDTDLTAWNTSTTDTPTQQPRISILGPVTVTGCGNPPRERRARYGELAVYLALHPRGVTADRIATDLWPESNRPPASGTIRELISTLRQWLGRGPDRTQYLPAAKNGVYHLPDRLLDSELLRRLHKRAQARADAADADGALADYVTALSLVRLPAESGVPIWEYTGQAYSWLHTIDHSDARHLQSAIADVSYEAADLALHQQNLDVARWAAEIGHAAVPDSDRPLCQLLRVAKANGQIDTARRLVDDILQVNDALSPEQCPEWALAAIREVFPAQGRKVAAP